MTTKKRNCDISNSLKAVAAAKFQDTFFLVEFDTLELEIPVICWIGSVDRVDDLCLTNQIYSALLNAFEFKEITEENAHLQMLLEDDET